MFLRPTTWRRNPEGHDTNLYRREASNRFKKFLKGSSLCSIKSKFGDILNNFNRLTYYHFNYQRLILTLSNHLRLYFPNSIFSQVFSSKTFYASLFSAMLAAYPTHPVLVNLITVTKLPTKQSGVKLVSSYIKDTLTQLSK
jgi:hypothetical protein